MRAILFPGQGAQVVGMGRDFYERSAAARGIFEKADATLGLKLSRICFEGPEGELARTDVCQPAILTCSAAIVAAMEERGVLDRSSFSHAAGLSLGEYTALWFAGVLTFEDAVQLVRVRGEAMQMASDRSPSSMASLLGATAAQAEQICAALGGEDVLVPANYLAPGNVVVSGSCEAISRVAERARELGVRKAVVLKVAGAFHSPLMQPAGPLLERALEGAALADAHLPVLSNVTSRPHAATPQGIREGLVGQLTHAVLWERSMQWLLEQGVREFLEPGPGTVLTGLLRQIDRTVARQAVGTVDDLEALGRDQETT